MCKWLVRGLGPIGVAALAACSPGGSKPAARPEAARTTTTPPTVAAATTTSLAPGGATDAKGRIKEALTIGAFLANTAKSWGDKAMDLEQLAKGFHEVYPALDLSGSAVAASPTSVSAAATTLVAKKVPSAKNPNILAFAIADTSGTCRGRVVFGYPTVTDELSVTAEAGDKCTARAVLRFAKIRIAKT